jgi:hypothetical protein
MRSTFYIHIGVHKTGTKSIQQTFFDNREKLLAHGINYLPGGPNHGPSLVSLLADNPHEDTRNIRRHVDTPEKAASYNAWTEHHITKALARNRSPKMVISGEGLSGLIRKEIERLKEILAPYAEAYRIIVYVRDPYGYANSASLQRLKTGAVLGTADRKMPLPNYRRKLGRYIRAFGRENVDIRIFDPQRFIGGDLITDFLVAIGESPQLAESLNVAHANQSMSHEAAMILSETNIAIPSSIDGRANRERAFALHLYVANIEGEKFTIDPDTYSKHEAEAQADLEWLHKTIGEPVFEKPAPRPASVPRWNEATVRSIKNVVRGMASELQELEKDSRLPAVPRPVVQQGLEWLREAYGPPGLGQPQVQSAAVPRFDQAGVRALGCFLHAIALTIQHLKAERAAREGRSLMFVNPRAAEIHFREVARLNPMSPGIQHLLSKAHLLSGHIREARAAAQEAARLAPQRMLFGLWLRLIRTAERWLSKPTAPVLARKCKRSGRVRRHAAKRRSVGKVE